LAGGGLFQQSLGETTGVSRLEESARAVAALQISSVEGELPVITTVLSRLLAIPPEERSMSLSVSPGFDSA
jgi:hypothetical protein